MKKFLTAGILSVFGFALLTSLAMASTHLLPSFTQTELDNNWEADRFFPTDGVNSVTEFERVNVARIGIDSEMTQAGTFQRTEGIKTIGAQNFGNEVQVDLYLDPDWATNAVRAGFWVVGDDGLGARDDLFGIIEFVNLEPSTSGVSAQGNHEGWRIWDSTTGWMNLDTSFEYGEWVTLGIVLDTSNQEYVYYINGEEVGTATGGENFIRELFLNSYNYGLDEFPNLENESYSAHWHAGLTMPETINECKRDGWKTFDNPTFKNQGDCVSYVQSNENASGNKNN
jgi:hypothetical protein